jgi:15-cis-phytoene synthase
MPDLAVDGATQRAAARLIRGKARSFHLASLFLPEHLRRDVQIVYSFYRTVDDLVDLPPAGWQRGDIEQALTSWEDAVLGRGPCPGALCEALVRVADRYRVPPAYFRMLLDGVRLDLDPRWIDTHDELIDYSVLVAGSVGMVMAHILGTPTPAALEAAKSLGVAMQLTNVLRDVAEDLDSGRVYLPRATLARVETALEGLTVRTMTTGLRRVMQDLALDARARYQEGAGGIEQLEPSARFAVSLAATLYSRILDKIEARDFDAFRTRARLTARDKWMIAVPAYLQHRRLSACDSPL